MIRRLHIQNFKCLLDVSLDLAPLTVLVGPNDSGKSSVLEALAFLGLTPHHGLAEIPRLLQREEFGPASLDALVWRRERQREMTWDVKGQAGPVSYRYVLRLQASGVPSTERLFVADEPRLQRVSPEEYRLEGQEPRRLGDAKSTALRVAMGDLPEVFGPVIGALSSSSRYRFEPTALRRMAQPSPDAQLRPSGDNLAAVMDAIVSGPSRSSVLSLERALHEAVPTLRGVSLKTVLDGEGRDARIFKALEFVLADSGKQAVTIPSAQASEGALVLTAFLALVYGATPDILLIEQPEDSLHPGGLKMVFELLRRVAAGEIGGRARQVVVTTHSPMVLSLSRPEEVRVVRRHPERGTWITPMTSLQNPHKLMDELAPFEMRGGEVKGSVPPPSPVGGPPSSKPGEVVIKKPIA